MGVGVKVGVGVSVGVSVKTDVVGVGVLVGVSVLVGVGVSVGPNNPPGPQPEKRRLSAKMHITTAFLFVFISTPALSRASPATAQTSCMPFVNKKMTLIYE